MADFLIYKNFLILMVLAFCGYASYTDIRWGKIKNPCSFGLIYVGLLTQVIFLIRRETTLSAFLITLLGGFGVSLAFYWFGLLAAGDVKLFYGLCLALPPQLFMYRQVRFFPPLVLAVNSFVPYAFALLLYLGFKSSLKQKWQVLREGIRLKQLDGLILNLVLFLAFAAMASRLLQKVGIALSIPLNGLIGLVIILILYSAARTQVQKWWPVIGQKVLWARSQKYLYYPVFLLAIVSFVWFKPPWDFFRRLLSAVVFVYFLGQLVELAGRVLDKEVPIGELKAGMILSEPIVAFTDEKSHITYQPGNRIPDIDLTIGNSASSQFGQPASTPTVVLQRGRLSEITISDLQKLAAEGSFHAFGERLKIQHPVRFAPVLLVGVLLTVFSRSLIYRWFF